MKTKTTPKKARAASKSATDTATKKPKATPSKQADEPTLPPPVFNATLRPKDALWLRQKAETEKMDIRMLVGIAIVAGSILLRDDLFHPTAPVSNVLLGRNTASSIWLCINRTAEDFTEEVAAIIPVDMRWEVATDAHNIGRKVSDWAGSLARLGVEVLKKDRGLRFMTDWRELDLLRAAHKLSFDEEAAAK